MSPPRGTGVDDPDGALGIGQAGLLERAANELTVTATLGTVSLPVLRTAMTKRSGLARCCLVGKLALTTATWKVPDGSSASWRRPPPQPATANAATLAAMRAQRHANTVDPSTAAGTYHRLRAPSR